MLSSPQRSVPEPGICSLLRHDWSPHREYALFSAAIGPRAGNMLSSPPRLVPAPGICSLLRRNWSPSRLRTRADKGPHPEGRGVIVTA
eukprot:1176042-Prorocentrum_minimum.AAC.2